MGKGSNGFQSGARTKILWLLSDLKIKSSSPPSRAELARHAPVSRLSLFELLASQFKARKNLILLVWNGFANPCQGFEQRRLLINFIIDSIRCFPFS